MHRVQARLMDDTPLVAVLLCPAGYPAGQREAHLPATTVDFDRADRVHARAEEIRRQMGSRLRRVTPRHEDRRTEDFRRPRHPPAVRRIGWEPFLLLCRGGGRKDE